MQDPKKRKWVDSLAADVVYVSGRKRPPGEMNGKSGNINNVCSQLYPPGTVVPGNELICIFDADQVCTTFTPIGTCVACEAALQPVHAEQLSSRQALTCHVHFLSMDFMQCCFFDAQTSC